MASFIQQAFSLLTTSPGNLAYHIVLAFSLVAALLSAVNFGSTDQMIIRHRMVIGLSIMLGLRFLLFASAALAWQELIDAQVALPALDWVVEMLSLLIIIWLWAFPEPARLADGIIGICAGLMVMLGILSLLLQQNQSVVGPFTAVSLNFTVHTLGIVLIIVGWLLLLTRRPVGWFVGLIMLGILGVGYAVEWLFFAPGIGNAGVVRLAEMIAYPLLIALPHRFKSTETPTAHEWAGSPGVDAAQSLKSMENVDSELNPEIQLDILPLINEPDPQNIGNIIAEIIGRTMRADFCLLLMPSEGEGLVLSYSYDLVNLRQLPPISLERKDIPILADAFERGRILRLPNNSNAPDLVSLAGALHLQQSGALLAVPWQEADGEPLWDVVLISPRAHKNWTQQDEDRVSALAGPMLGFMQRTLRSQIQLT